MIYEFICDNCNGKQLFNHTVAQHEKHKDNTFCGHCNFKMRQNFYQIGAMFHIRGICKAEFGYARNWDEMEEHLRKEGKPVGKDQGIPLTEAQKNAKQPEKKIQIFT